MKINNMHNIHPMIVKAVCNQISRPSPDFIRVTELINPPQIRQLMLKHYDELEVDVSENLWALFGTSIHAGVFAKPDFGVACEVKLRTVLPNGIELRGTTDMIDFNLKTIYDLKITSVWKVVHGDFSDYSLQLNIYRWMAKQMGIINAEKLANICILKDWKINEVGGTYPAVPFVEVQHPIGEHIQDTIVSRAILHQKAADGDCIPCTWDEMSFHGRDVYKVKVPGKKRSLRNFDDIAQAQAMAEQKPKAFVETVKATPKRCLEYCPVRAVCKQGQEMIKKYCCTESEE